jgi:hypothetical protein
MALPFLPAIDAKRDGTLKELLKERERQLGLSRRPSKPPSPPPPFGREKDEGERHHARLDWLSQVRARTTTTTRPGILELHSHHSDASDDEHPPSQCHKNAPSPPAQYSQHSAAALPSTVDRIFPQRRRNITDGDAQILRNGLDHAAPWLDKWALPATEIFRACARMLVTPFGDGFALDPLQLNSPALFFLPTASVPSRNRPDGHVTVLDLGGSAQGE